MIELGMVIDEHGKLQIVVQDHNGVRFFELVGMNEQGNWLVL